MKQKNIILVAVAVGCGLVAAFLTSTMGAGTKKEEEKIQVLVASKDLSVGIQLKKEEIDSYVEVKEFTKDTVPAQYITTVETTSTTINGHGNHVPRTSIAPAKTSATTVKAFGNRTSCSHAKAIDGGRERPTSIAVVAVIELNQYSSAKIAYRLDPKTKLVYVRQRLLPRCQRRGNDDS